jgi:hypothetical protein
MRQQPGRGSDPRNRRREPAASRFRYWLFTNHAMMRLGRSFVGDRRWNLVPEIQDRAVDTRRKVTAPSNRGWRVSNGRGATFSMIFQTRVCEIRSALRLVHHGVPARRSECTVLVADGSLRGRHHARLRASHTTWRAPPPTRALGLSSRVAKPARTRRDVNVGSSDRDHTARTPPARSARFARASPAAS